MSSKKYVEGAIIDSRYKVIRDLGEGGMASVYLVTDMKTKGEVALKINLQCNSEAQQELYRRFQREIDILSKLNHPSISRVYESGRVSSGDYYFTMEYLAGQSLQEYLSEKRRLEPEEVLSFVQQLTRAFDTYHSRGIIHRDIKPANIIKVDDRFVLMDFGLAGDVNRTRLTATGAILGTPMYLSPEMVLGERADSRSDIYQLGLLVFELLTGQLPFKENSLQNVLRKILTADTPKTAELVPRLPSEWDLFIGKCMAKKPGDRYCDGKSARLALENLLREEATKDEDLLFGETAVSSLAIESKTEEEAAEEKANSSRHIISAFCVLLCIFIVFVFSKPTSKTNGQKGQGRVQRVTHSLSELSVKRVQIGWRIAWRLEPPAPARVYVDCGKRGAYSVMARAENKKSSFAVLPYLPTVTEEVSIKPKNGNKNLVVTKKVMAKVSSVKGDEI